MIRKLTSLCLISALSLHGSLWAETLDRPDIEEIILVTAHRTAVSDLITPYSYTLIDEQEISRKNFRTTPEIFRQVPGVLLQKTAHGQGSPYIRGFTGYQNVMLVDGIRLNNSVFRAGPNQYWNTVDPLTIERFEIIKGPSSSMYGSDGIGGTVNSISKMPEFNLSTTDLLFRGANAEQSAIFNFDSNLGLSNRNAIRFGGSLKDFGDLKTGQGTLENSGYQEHSLHLKWLSQINTQWSLTAAHFLVEQQDVPRTHRTIFSQSFSGTTVGSELQRNLDQRRELSYLRLQHSANNGFYDEMSATISYHQQQESRDRIRTGNRTDLQGFEVGTLGMNMQFVNAMQEDTFVYGVDIYQDRVDSFSSSNAIQGPIADDATYTSSGVFAEWRSDISDKIKAVAGLRYDYFEVDARKVQDPVTGNAIRLTNDWSNLTANLRIIKELEAETSMIFGGVSQGFRAPNLSDLTRYDSARSNEYEIPALDLDSEDYIAVELGYRYRETNVHFDASVYYTFIDGQILSFPTGQQNQDNEIEVSKANVSDGYVSGVETNARFNLNPQWRLLMAASYMTGKTDQFASANQQAQRDYISRLMPLMGNVSLQYQRTDAPWYAELQLLLASRADRLSERDKGDTDRIPANGTPGYSIVNLYAGYEFSESIQVYASIENLFDKNYRVHGSGQNEVRRNFILSLSFTL